MGLVQEFSKCGLAPLVVALILLGLARAYPGRFLYFTSQASTRLITTEPGGNDICLLASSKPTEYELSTGKNHFHEISPDSTQDLPVVADQRHTHVGTGRHKLTDFAFRQEKPTPVSLVAAASETYRLEFRSPDKELVSGCCQVRLEDTTPATAQDK